MSSAVRHRIMTFEDFLAWEARQEVKYEFDGFEPVAMAGGSRNHARIQRNLAVAVSSRLRGTGGEFLGSDMKLVTANRARYPDGQVVCGPAEGDDTFTTAPVILFEVVSPGDEARDRVVKAEEYLRIGSVQAYVMIEQDRPAVTLMLRAGAGWASQTLDATQTLDLAAIGIGVPVSELYADVFPP